MIKEKRCQKNFVLYKRQADAIEELANQSPTMEMSAIARILIDLGLAYLKRSEAAQRIIRGEVFEDLIDDEAA